MSDEQFRNLDVSRWPQAVRVEWSREECDDHDSTPEPCGDPEYAQADEERAAAWRRDEWRFIGIRAKASLFVPIGGTSFACYELTSPGLFGIESDSDPDYLASVYTDEKAALRDALAAIGAAFNGTAQLVETDA